MDPATFGIVFVGASGLTLVGIALLEDIGWINTSFVKIVLETTKYGAILALLNHLSKIFF